MAKRKKNPEEEPAFDVVVKGDDTRQAFKEHIGSEVVIEKTEKTGEEQIPVSSSKDVQKSKMEEYKPPIMVNTELVSPGWYRVSNSSISHVADSNDPRGYRDVLAPGQTKSTFSYLIRWPRFAARSRNLWGTMIMNEEYKEYLLTLRKNECMALDKADMNQRLTYMRDKLGIDVSEWLQE